MEVNALPKYEMDDNPTGCCPRFDPEVWDRRELSFQNKPFVRVRTKSLFHIPLNMGDVFRRTFKKIESVHADSQEDFVVLSDELSPWSAEHFFSVTKDVPGLDMTRLSGEYLTRVFEGPYRKLPDWRREMADHVGAQGKDANRIFFFYTTCPKCAKHYGKNYVVAVADVS